tara:strand:+ start:155 stop:358 length:204 start_codon:yes stop_codon:yes gene_type:complete
MSSEQANINNHETPKYDLVNKKIPDRVDINKLMSKVREEKKQQNFKNLITFSIFVSFIVFMGIFVTL